MNKLTEVSASAAVGAVGERYVGHSVDRVDGRAKVTGEAKYSSDFTAADLAHGVVLNSSIARGLIQRIDTTKALTLPGVIAVFTHENRPDLAWYNHSHKNKDTPTAHFRPLADREIHYSGQPIALIVAEDAETARYASSLIEVQYAADSHQTSLLAARDNSNLSSETKAIAKKTPDSRGNAAEAYFSAPIKNRTEYHFSIEHHNPMAPHASTVIWREKCGITVHDKTQGPKQTHDFVCEAFEFPKSDVQVISPYVGGAFGLAIRPQYQLFLAVMAARELKRSVRVVLSREQMFTIGYRPEALQTISLAAERNGTLTSIMHDSIGNTSQLEDFEESVVKWSGLLYHCPNVELSYRLARLDLYTPTDMRAPGAATGVNAFEQAIDEMAYLVRMDPLEFRLKNYAERDAIENRDFTSKELKACYAQGAEHFGWNKRTGEPRSMRDGRELVGWGMATGIWEAFQQKASARATFSNDGILEIASAAADIGTGTYTILTQIAADTLGLPMSRITTKLGDSSLPPAPIEGGSSGAASFGSAVMMACEALRKEIANQAIKLKSSPFGRASVDDLAFSDEAIVLKSDHSLRLSLVDVLRCCGKQKMEAEASAEPNKASDKQYSSYAHSAVFVEVKVDEELGQVRVTRVVNAVAAGKILNPKTAKNQISGGVVWGISKALCEEGMLDNSAGRFMNHNFAEYHIPSNADIYDIDVIFVEEIDRKVNVLGVKGVGEIGIVGTSAAVANAIFHATGNRIYELPITIDKVLRK
ncbi:aldehyde oxidase [Advenella kashmirensis W13003]|uniref:Aldehyde oxidase n=1 Tax=Advenella kashmirensis W13003 TaxID=1424334 RepID=V8QWD5_9BURK|nr:xanthine dehydrogenase family protein molybdopterin-binding subunit [Advenella kashmirensis]ETF03610.1 aldehyde oxidase [Advenella kashmirensis W13003]